MSNNIANQIAYLLSVIKDPKVRNLSDTDKDDEVLKHLGTVKMVLTAIDWAGYKVVRKVDLPTKDTKVNSFGSGGFGEN